MTRLSLKEAREKLVKNGWKVDKLKNGRYCVSNKIGFVICKEATGYRL